MNTHEAKVTRQGIRWRWAVEARGPEGALLTETYGTVWTAGQAWRIASAVADKMTLRELVKQATR